MQTTRTYIMTNDIIYFYPKSKKYSFLCNSYISRFVMDDVEYYHVEGYYQSKKFEGENEKLVLRLREIHNPAVCKSEAKNYSMSEERSRHWKKSLGVKTMKHAVFCKFLSDSKLCDELKSTGDNTLVYLSKHDKYWGVVSNEGESEGENKLGNILMEVRDFLEEYEF